MEQVTLAWSIQGVAEAHVVHVNSTSVSLRWQPPDLPLVRGFVAPCAVPLACLHVLTKGTEPKTLISRCYSLVPCLSPLISTHHCTRVFVR
jgi:hypothetical protein